MSHVHVYLHNQRQIPRLLTRDAEEGKWVTINGAAVHIGAHGKVDKGPKELMDKSEHGAHAEHHRTQAKLHSASAEAKGGKHEDTPLHRKAAAEHQHAAHQFVNSEENAAAGNMHAAKVTRARAEQHAAKAKEHGDELAKRNPQQAEPKKQKPTEKPESHKALHADAEDDVRGSDKHHAEHKRLVKEYDKAGADWQRHAINNQIASNAGEAVKHKADSAHKLAEAASKNAHETDEPEHHQAAKEAIDKAIGAHEKAGHRQDKIKELEKMRKPHHAKTLKEKERLKREAAKAGKKAEAAGTPGAPGKTPADKPAPAGTTPAAKPGERKPTAPAHKPNVWRSNRPDGRKHGGSGLEKIAARAAKRVAQEAADQDDSSKRKK